MIGKVTVSRLNPGRAWLVLLVGGLGFTILYALFLSYQENRAATALEALRLSDPDSYLERIRLLEGFDDYVRLFATLRKFDRLRSNPPVFMVGRWTLREKPERISSLGPTACTDPMTFGYGRLEVPSDEIGVRAMFRLDGETLIVAPFELDHFIVQLVSYGAAINHLELTPPGRGKIFYAYPCAT